MIEPLYLYIASTLVYVLGMFYYFRMAGKYRIIDRPNERSSHLSPTVRGGGIVFVLAILIFTLQTGAEAPFFLLGFFAVSAVSFTDDIRQVAKRWRLGIQLISTLLLIYEVTQGGVEWWQWGVFLILSMSMINFYNFMDGINGITAFYSLVLLGTLFFLNQEGVLLVRQELIVLPAIAIVVFSFFNARKRARCFAGDVGSVSLAFLAVYLLVLLCWQQQSYLYIWLVGIYGVDAVLTIIQRLFLGHNILQGHRLHLYQLMANEGKIPHVSVSLFYALIQLLLNIFLLAYVIPGQFDPVVVNALLALFFVSVYVPVKYGFGKIANRSTKKHNKHQSVAG
jgi:UDP-N-acetylmuramyl pentapeptide phosphotransferase/UDP-N-acetylglucosamine-1-phosphate transferase